MMRCYMILMGGMLLALGMFSCSSADTLGDEAPVEITITGEPTYNNGVGELLRLKCGYCHANPIPDIAPDVIVKDLDLTRYETRVVDNKVIRGADALGRWLKDGILEHEVHLYLDNRKQPVPIDVRKMPLSYGTQVTASERSALLAWAEAGLPRGGSDQNPVGDADEGIGLWENCSYCHGFCADGVQASDGRYYGPAIDRSGATIAKIKSMWLWSRGLESDRDELSDERAADIRAYILSIEPDCKQ